MTEVWYRYHDFRWAAPLNEYDEPVGKGRADVVLLEFPVKRHTPKGVVLDDYGRERRVCHHWRKKFAAPTIEEAGKQFLARKKAQSRILKAQLDHVDEAVGLFMKNKVLSELQVDVAPPSKPFEGYKSQEYEERQ